MDATLRALVLLVAAGFGAATTTHAQSDTPQSPFVITKSGHCILGNNLSYAGTSGNIIEIKASNVTLDLNGFYIAGPEGQHRPGDGRHLRR